jgi:hypothetical protein
MEPLEGVPEEFCPKNNAAQEKVPLIVSVAPPETYTTSALVIPDVLQLEFVVMLIVAALAIEYPNNSKEINKNAFIKYFLFRINLN